MLRRAPKVFLTASALAPILLTLAFLALRAKHLWTSAGWLLSAGIVIFITRRLLIAATHQLEVLPVKLAKVKSSDREVISFLLAYVLPLAFANAHDFSIDAWAVGFIVVIFAIIVWGTHAYDFNPLLGMIGFHFFEVETEHGVTYILVSKRPIVSVRQVTEVVQLTEYVLLDKA